MPAPSPRKNCARQAMLGEDGVAVVEHAIQKLGVKEENIVIHGHSIGGGVLAFLTRHFKKCVFVNDRSFWDLGAEVRPAATPQ